MMHRGLLLAAAWVFVGAACSSQSNNANGGSQGSGGKVGSGGAAGTGGGSGGKTTGAGGSSAGAGGQVGNGGTVMGSGGQSTGSGGATTGSGGATTGSGGKTTGSGGSTGLGGTTASSRGGSGGSGSGGSSQAGSDGSAGTTGGYPLGNPAVPSTGCGKALPSTYKAGGNTTFKDMTSAGIKREYIVYIPSNYDSSKPYRLLFAWHPMGGSASGTAGGFYSLKAQDTGGTTIFVAPQGYTDSMPWRSDDKDHIFFDDMLKLFKSDLCIDVSRVFATGFSFGGMETYSLSVARQQDLRGGVGIAPANYNIYVTKTKSHLPIAWMQTTGMSDNTCPWQQGSSATNGAKYIAIEHGTDNGCTVPNPVPNWTSGGHLCVDFAGCKPGYPTKICTFNGGHTDNASDGSGNWIATESWKFITQF